MSSTPTILFKDNRVSSCFMDQIYDPDIDGPYPEDDPNFPRVIPHEGATVIERDTGVLYYVISVDEVTYKTTLGKTRIVVDADDEGNVVRIISYGNDKYMLYYVTDTEPTKLIIDSKLVLYGNNLDEYRLVKTNKRGEQEVISLDLDSDEVERGNRIPMASLGAFIGAKQCTNCHTYADLVEGDTVELQCFDNVGVLCATVTLFTRNGTRLNDLLSDSDIIVKLDAVAMQMLGDDFYVYQRQDPSHIGIIPRLEYNDGSISEIAIDNKTCFLYGLDDFTPSFPGQTQKLLIKKFLGPKEFSKNDISLNGQRYLVCEKTVTVLANKTLDGIKVSIMPIWNATTNEYMFRYIAYSDRRDKIIDVTQYVELLTPFDFSKFYQTQHLKMAMDLSKVFGTEANVPYQQNNWITLKPYKEMVRYQISDTADLSVIYGAESPHLRRPTIRYDASIEKYYIPTSRHPNVGKFIEAFYECANPPYNVVSETKYMTPTHFTIRALDNLTTLITTPIPVERYNQAWNINRKGNQNILVGANVIVEFLAEQGDSYLILYGVPVDVYTGTYNTENVNFS